ncbi:MAG: DUF4097 family beta strand repeat-containing protein [Balneolaceae bacterium]|nr:DUF4097 family beta strand repeat-containing protein [Balneolaceae bacterium]
MLKRITLSFIISMTLAVATLFSQSTDEFNLDQTYAIDFEGTIHLQSDDAEVQIIGSDREDVRVNVNYELTVRGITFGESNDFEMIVEEDDGNLVMDGGNGQLKIDTDDGDIQIRNGSFAFIEASSDDSDIEVTTALFDDGDYRFDLDDADLMFNVVAGGGEINIRHDDSDISTSPQFESVRDEDEHSIYRLPGGTASVNIRSDDGDINLRVY